METVVVKTDLEWLVRPKDVTGNVSDIDNLLGKYYLNEETGLEEPKLKNHKHLEKGENNKAKICYKL